VTRIIKNLVKKASTQKAATEEEPVEEVD